MSAIRAQLATFSGGLAPDVYVNAWLNWLVNLSKEPAMQIELMQDV